MSTATAVKERPILFSGPMVRAILDGRKTQTRRISKPQPGPFRGDVESGLDSNNMSIHMLSGYHDGDWRSACPYGVPDERLWVRESLRGVIDTKFTDEETMPIAAYVADGSHIWTKDAARVPWRWQRTSLPSIHMPRDLCRIVLEITDVRVQRLQEISEDDAEAEGVEMGYLPYNVEHRTPPTPVGYRPMFKRLWEQINGEGSWEANPWVWALTFKRIEAAHA